MKFDKAKVMTPFNCEEVKVGSKGYVADSRRDLIARVTIEETERYYTIVNIDLNDKYPFKTKENGCWEFFYPVEEPREPEKRPCTREELLEMLTKQGIPMLKRKTTDNKYYIISKLDSAFVTFCDDSIFDFDYEDLCVTFTLLDGTELWVEE